MSTPDQPQQHTVSATELFAHYHQVLRRNVRAIVNTSDENIEDACMFAWTKFLSWEFEHVEVAYSWLRTAAVREAIKLERRSRRTSQLETRGGPVEFVDPRDQLRLSQLLAQAGDVVRAAGLSPRQTQMIALQMLGRTYDEIAAQTGDSRRTVERQILRARDKLADALSEHGG
jgi:RNA polymerase sigma factor (sigma-70 family)